MSQNSNWKNDTQGLSPELFVIEGVDTGSTRLLRPHISFLQDAWKRFKKNKLAIFGL
ncbi:MAG: hypothetical protein HUJ80_03830, partial [Firmicutes bacterium]|nr:hypothetical protein [Bacillota bacterium]